MRPWTGVVLSDYGRDRLAFQSYDELFDPSVKPRGLPVANRVILKMQATWWIRDYLSHQTHANVWQLLSSPPNHLGRQRHRIGDVLKAATDLMHGDGLSRLHNGLKQSLQASDDEIDAVLWDHPRALVTAVIPSIIRRLVSLQAYLDVPTTGTGMFQWRDALWEFVPTTLFAPLQTPEVGIHMPSR